ncbi:MAG: zinc-dependent metalloprotease [Phycisphaerales bacterium]|nr:zinc-dependent metalloprotease [Phycisphaerales bacterium]
MKSTPRKRTSIRKITGIAGALIGLSALAGGSAIAQEPNNVNDANPTIEIDLAALQAMAAARGGGSSKANASKIKKWKDISDGFERVVSTADGNSFYDLYVNTKTNDLYAELPRGYASQKHFFAMTVAGGEIFAGLQSGDMYTQWRRIGDRLALIQPQIAVRSTGDQESKDSVETVWTDRVILDVPIAATGPNGQPMIDMDSLLVGKASSFFGRSATGLNRSLTTIHSAKAFPKNIEIAFEGPVRGGIIKRFHYSISHITGSKGFKPREADQRVGYFVTTFTDLGKFDWNDTSQRLINRWNIQKADPKLSMSPPKEPIVYYIEHTVPIRYRRYVREGILEWNKAFREIGIDGAIEVRYQDKATGANMEKDPEDVRYNFIRWISNDVATAIGPSRVNSMTGEILDADVVLTDGWMRVFTYRWEDLLGDLATQGMSPQTLGWLEANPQWDPRLRLASPARREEILVQRSTLSRTSSNLLGINQRTVLIGDDQFDGLADRTSQVSGMCEAASGMALNLASMRMHLSMIDMLDDTMAISNAAMEPDMDPEMIEMIKKQLEENPELRAMIPADVLAQLDSMAEEDDEAKEDEDEESTEVAEEKKEKVEMIDGVPEWFVGPMLTELVSHEIGHTLGLRHNFKGSSRYSFDEINSDELADKSWSTTVMDYTGINIRMPEFGESQGKYSADGIGPYDFWAIEYGYGSGDLKELLSQSANPDFQYGTDEDAFGPDPTVRRYDMGSDPLTFAKNQMAFASHIRENLLESFVEEGDSWSRARRGYLISLSQQMSVVSMMGNWVGSAYVYRDKKGDPEGRAPIEPVAAQMQRDAMQFVIDNSFQDAAYGITPELLTHITTDKWWDQGTAVFADPAMPIHDRIMGMQASSLTMLLNPSTLQRVYDYEMFVEEDEDAFTLAELLEAVTEGVWSEINEPSSKKYTARKPMISSMRRNLQLEHLGRMIEMSMATDGFSAAQKPVRTLAAMHLREIKDHADKVLKGSPKLDVYTKAHLQEVSIRVEKALDADYIYNANAIGAASNPFFMLGRDK